MEFKLPILKEKLNIDTGEVSQEEGYLDCMLNMTVDAQTTWEDNFPEQAKNIGLFDYAAKIKDVKITDEATLRIALKLVYCFILFDRKMTFREFTRLFSMSNPDYMKKLCDIITKVLKVVNDRYDSKKNF